MRSRERAEQLGQSMAFTLETSRIPVPLSCSQSFHVKGDSPRSCYDPNILKGTTCIKLEFARQGEDVCMYVCMYV
jgi:hypothetical protein